MFDHLVTLNWTTINDYGFCVLIGFYFCFEMTADTTNFFISSKYQEKFKAKGRLTRPWKPWQLRKRSDIAPETLTFVSKNISIMRSFTLILYPYQEIVSCCAQRLKCIISRDPYRHAFRIFGRQWSQREEKGEQI